MTKNDGLLMGWPYKQINGKQVIDWAKPIYDKGEGHILTCALTGEGKGVSYSMPSLLSWPGSVIAIDLKGELSAVTARHRRAMGHDVHILDPFGITGRKNTSTLNPLDLIKKDDPGRASSANQLAEMLISDVKIHKDPYWHQRAKTLLAAVCLHQIEHPAGDYVTLDAIADIVNSIHKGKPYVPSLKFFKSLLKDEEKAKQMRDEYKEKADAEVDILEQMNKSQWRAVRDGAAMVTHDRHTTFNSIQSIAASALSIAEGGQVSDAMGPSTVPVQDLVDGKPMTIYLVFPPDKLRSHGKLLKMWLGLLLSVLSKRRNWSGPSTLFMVDEAAQLGPMDELLTFITLMRSYGVKVWSFWQDLSQLKGLYPYEWETIINNSRTQLWFGINNMLVASQCSQIIGGFTPEELLKLDPDDAVIVRNRQLPEIIHRPNYLRQDLWQGLYDDNPYINNNLDSEQEEFIWPVDKFPKN